MGKRAVQIILLIIQCLITVIYGGVIAHMTYIYVMDGGADNIESIQGYFPQFVILLCSLIPQIIIHVKRKMHTQDGDIFPVLFTMIALQVSLVVPSYIALTEAYYFSPALVIYLMRFSLLGTAAIFLIAALRYDGFNSSYMTLCVLITLGFSLFMSALAPTSFSPYTDGRMFENFYDASIQLMMVAFYIAAILTFLITAAREKTSLATSRFFGYLFLIVGVYLAAGSTLALVVISSVLYIAGTTILSINVRESF